MQVVWQDNIDPDNMTYEVWFVNFLSLPCASSDGIIISQFTLRHQESHIQILLVVIKAENYFSNLCIILHELILIV